MDTGTWRIKYNIRPIPFGVAVGGEGGVRGEQDGCDQAESDQLQPVLGAKDIPLEGHHHLKSLPEGDEGEENGEDDRHGSRSQGQEEDDGGDDKIFQPTAQEHLQQRFNSFYCFKIT